MCQVNAWSRDHELVAEHSSRPSAHVLGLKPAADSRLIAAGNDVEAEQIVGTGSPRRRHHVQSPEEVASAGRLASGLAGSRSPSVPLHQELLLDLQPSAAAASAASVAVAAADANKKG